MRNKDLMEQNFSLFEQLQKALHDIELLKQQLFDCQSEIELIKSGAFSECKQPQETKEDIEQDVSQEETVELDEQEEPEADEAIDNGEETKETVAAVPISLGVSINRNADAEYGSEVIGKIVVNSSSYASEKPQVANLIFGKTEMAKAEIMSIIASEISLQQKKDEIDIVFSQAIEYFKSVN